MNERTAAHGTDAASAAILLTSHRIFIGVKPDSSRSSRTGDCGHRLTRSARVPLCISEWVACYRIVSCCGGIIK